MTLSRSLKRARKKRPTALGWVGLVGDNIDLDFNSSVADYGRVYKTRAEAKNCYTSVRRVRLVVIGR